jgi:hypothetical protein
MAYTNNISWQEIQDEEKRKYFLLEIDKNTKVGL